MSQYTTEPCGGGGDWYWVTDGEWTEGGDMSESTARAIAERLSGQAADIERLRARIKQYEAGMDSAGLSWMRSCDELTAECFRHKTEIERLRDVVAAVAFLQGHITQNAGGGRQQFAYVWQSVWDEFERRTFLIVSQQQKEFENGHVIGNDS